MLRVNPGDRGDTPYLIPRPAARKCSLQLCAEQTSFGKSQTLIHSRYGINQTKEITFLKISFTTGVDTPDSFS